MREEERKKRVVVELLGWLTESSIMPKKHHGIEGIGASSILELKAELYKSQEESKKSKELNGPDVEYHRAKKKIAPHDTFSGKNSSVDSRALKDKLGLKAIKDGSASYAALEKKAELYEKLERGELSDEEDKEKYCFDLFRKGFEKEEAQQPRVDPTSDNVQTGNEDSESDVGPSLFNTKFVCKAFHTRHFASTMMLNRYCQAISHYPCFRRQSPITSYLLEIEDGKLQQSRNDG